MSRSVDIDFTFNESIDAPTFVRALLGGGLRVSTYGKVTYLIDEDGMFDWEKAPMSQLDKILSRMREGSMAGRTVGITVLFSEGEHGGDFLIHPERTSASFVIGINPKPLAGSKKFCDLGWYLNQLVPLLEPLGLSEIEARDSS
ncbi:hypothetical protein ACFY78_42270 [Streptomyces olindensis]|uniref:hypothetical protein n=1 Tax=Streptomyces olindensis TaxID=358823 RepID=UPI003680CE32